MMRASTQEAESTTETLRRERFRQRIFEEWTDPTLVAAYRKWDAEESAWGREATEIIVQRAQIVPGLKVLDLASGHGEPSLALAQAIGPQGHVTATDQGHGLIAIAEEKARRAGLSNMTFRVADAHELPFPDGTFDRVTCKWGVMYFADYPQALRESYRVLKPGGRAVFMAWGPAEGTFFETLLGRIVQRASLPPREPGEPTPFTFAEPGSLSAALREAGFREVEEELLTIAVVFPGAPERCWEYFLEISPPFVPVVEGLAPEGRKQVIDKVLPGLRQSYDGRQVTLPAKIVVTSGSRSAGRADA